MRTGALAALGIGAVLALAPPAMADSLVFIRDNNVWLSNPDGSGQYQVTLDGTAGSPYESPSQSDGGTIMAIRRPPGGRNQLWRMTQSGQLLNAPINTPAPGPAGALDARLSPNGGLVAYWFVTTVSDPYCAYCVNVSNRALFSHPDRFTNYDEIGTPNTGGWPSWVTNDTITIGNGSATQWYYKLGMSEADDWFTSSDLSGQIKTLLDAEVAPTVDRLAVVHGDNQESILFGKMSGLPPAAVTPPDPDCLGYQGPSGKFVNPTWSSNGQLLAWQEDDGIWVGQVPADLANCTGLANPVLRIAGGREPDLSPAAINPGSRPGCGNPGNPATCPPGCTTCGPCTTCGGTPGADLKKKLADFLASESSKLRKLGVHGLRKKKRTALSYQADQAGVFTVRFTGTPIMAASRPALLASGKHTFTAAGSARVTMKLTPKGVRALRRAKGVRGALKATFTPAGGAPTTATRKLRLPR
jgi:hypothetical protein